MFKVHAMISTLLGLLLNGVAIWATYDPEIRASRRFWVIGTCATIVAHVLWTVLAQSAQDQRRVMTYALVWDIGFTLVSVLVPALLFDLKLSVWGYVALALMAGGGLLMKEYGLS